MVKRCCRWSVTLHRWDVYRLTDVVADTAAEAEEKALEIYEEDYDRFEHADGGVDSVLAEPDED
jgi:hypothetical protein